MRCDHTGEIDVRWTELGLPSIIRTNIFECMDCHAKAVLNIHVADPWDTLTATDGS
ncbi:hypothetical protein [Cellulomonas palmilytica]|uniref:hypothetical protein n=1 Tax=Cellulomonas palmilytica TaxID=2608402 RepID=UPI001F218686|nr:hypothetical protein [Cellulomonas palmilytica]UJP39883.1 hypothetical protein F1D97_16625 [Cellulomonas palmilytica]